MDDFRKRLFAVGAVTLVLLVGFTVMIDEQEEEVEVEALGALGGFVIGFVAGAFAMEMYHIMKALTSTDNEELSREGETNVLFTFLFSGSQDYANNLSQNATIWPLTNDHWIRQAELAASALWKPDTEYDSSVYTDVLEATGIYFNLGQMIDNMTAQLNAHWQEITERVKLWNSEEFSDIYGNGKMTISLVLESVGKERVVDVSGGGDFDLRTGVVLDDVSSGQNKAWLSGGDLYASEACTITNGTTSYNLKKGWNPLPDTTEFDYGVYTFAEGVTYCGNIVSLLDPEGATGKAGIVFIADGEEVVVTVSQMIDTGDKYKPSCDVTDGNQNYDTVNLRVSPEESENTQNVDISDILARSQMLLQVLDMTLTEMNSSAGAVWDIFSSAGQATPYLTTLMVPEIYNNMALTQEQKEMITALAMQQLYEYWDRYGTDAVKEGYEMTFDSLTLFCRGNVVIDDLTVDGETQTRQLEYKDVIFTPIFGYDMTLTTGRNSIEGTGFVMIWAKDQSLSTFNVSDTNTAELLWIGDGATLEISNIKYSGEYVNSVKLDASNIEDIDPDLVTLPEIINPNPDNELDELIRLIFVVIGVLMMVYAISSSNWKWLILGLALIVIGFLVAEPLADAFEKWFGWRISL